MAKPATTAVVVFPGAAPALPPLPRWWWWLVDVYRVLALADALLWALLRAGLRRAGRVPPAALAPAAALTIAGYCAVRGLLGYLADPRPILAVLAAPLLAAIGFVLLIAWARVFGGGTSAAAVRIGGGERALTQSEVEAHERRHVRVLDGLGIKHHRPQVWRDWGGYWAGIVEIIHSRANLRAWHALSQAEQAAVYAAGAMGPEGEIGCSSDLREVGRRWCLRSTAEAIARRFL